MKISYGVTVHNESEEINKLLEILELTNYKNKQVGFLSLGEIKKLELAR